MAKKVIRLTESDLQRIVKRVIIEDMGGMDDVHPTYGNKNFNKMSREDILNLDRMGSSEYSEDTFEDEDEYYGTFDDKHMVNRKNKLRFGAKNLGDKSMTKLQKLAEQDDEAASGQKKIELSDEYTNMSFGVLKKYPLGFVTPKLLYKDKRGEGNVGWEEANVMRLGTGDLVLILGNRQSKTDLKYYPTISITQAKDGNESRYTMGAGASDLKSLISALLNINTLTEVDYTNIFKSLRTILPSYVKMNSKTELDALSKSIPNSASKVNNATTSLDIT